MASDTRRDSGSQALARWDPFAKFEDLYQRMGRLSSGAFDDGWQPRWRVQGRPAGRPELRRGRRSGRFDCRVLLPGQAHPDKVTAALADGVLSVTVPKARRIQITS